jgi:hypothetical protein
MTVHGHIWLTSVCIYIDGILHLKFRRSSFVGLQSWPDESCFTIEITVSGAAPITAQYEKRETWAAVLDTLDKLDITAV